MPFFPNINRAFNFIIQYNMKQTIYFLLVVNLLACKQNNQQDMQSNRTYTDASVLSDSININNGYFHSNSIYYNQIDKSYHIDPNYKYEYRTDGSDFYEYNYDITGSDENGNSVYGNIDIEGKYGGGYIEDDYGNEKYIEVEWVDYGVLEGVDEDGNYYEFEVDE